MPRVLWIVIGVLAALCLAVWLFLHLDVNAKNGLPPVKVTPAVAVYEWQPTPYVSLVQR